MKKSQVLLISLIFSLLSGCAYKVGYGNRELPNGIRKVFIPVFLNDTLETGQEVAFTNELRRGLKRSGAAEIVSERKAEAVLEGRIMRITNSQFALNQRGREEEKTKGLVFLPKGASLVTKYLMKIRVELRLKNKAGKTVWKQWLDNERLYSAPVITLPGVNSATSLYNISEKQRITEELAALMMHEAVGRLTESF